MIQEINTQPVGAVLYLFGTALMPVVYAAKYFSWWLGSRGLALSYDLESQVTSSLLLGMNREAQGQFEVRLEAKADIFSQYMVIPLVPCEMLAVRHQKVIHVSTKRLLALEMDIGVNDYTYTHSESRPELTDVDFSRIIKGLNGELSRLANYGNWVSSNIILLKDISGEKSLQMSPSSNISDSMAEKSSVALREQAEYVLGWNTNMLARILCQQKICQGQIQTI